MRIFEKYVKKFDYSSYEDFKQNFKVDVPDHFNFAYDVLDVLADEKPDKRALVWVSESGETRTFNFSDLKRLSDKAANYLHSLGIVKGDKVMIMLKRHYEFWYIIMALHKIGAITIPATYQLTSKDIEYRVEAAGIKAIISSGDGDVENRVDEADVLGLEYKILLGKRDGWLDFISGAEAASDVFIPEERAENDDIMLLFFTSGTTGMPKMVAHSYLYPLGLIPTSVHWQNVDPEGLHLTIADTGWAKGIEGRLYAQWLAETTVFSYSQGKFLASGILKAICDYKVTTLCAAPTIYRHFIKEDLSKYDFSSLKYAVSAGEPLNPEVFNQFKDATGIEIREGYGQTETKLIVANFKYVKPKAGSMGKPTPMFDVDIVSETGESCEYGVHGEIVLNMTVKRPGMFLGYYRDDKLTKKVWHDGYYHTGDMAWRDKDGYYWYVGRADDIIKSSGYRIGPFEVESALLEHPSVLEAAVTGVPDAERGQIVKATIVLTKGWEPSEQLKKELKEHVKRVTAPYKYPRQIEFVDELPKTISGKIRRVELRERDQKK